MALSDQARYIQRQMQLAAGIQPDQVARPYSTYTGNKSGVSSPVSTTPVSTVPTATTPTPAPASTPAATTPATGTTMADILSGIQWPAGTNLPSYERSFGQYLQELMGNNPTFSIPVPNLAALTTPGVTTTPVTDPEEFRRGWQEFIGSLSNRTFSEQQLLAGLQYNPTAGWTRKVDTAMLGNPEEL